MKLKALKVAIVSVYLIFLAGSVVRMTGSGMGCPDWPKCFGYLVPPTSEDQITWKSQVNFKKGAIVIYEEALFVAEKDLVSGQGFNPSNWEKYTRHDYAKFNVYHTWTEYINRLSSVLAGFVFLFLLVCVTFIKPKIKGVALWCYLAFGGMLFEAWLGKTVVDSFLTPYVITIHMLVGLVIIGLLVRAYFLEKRSYLGIKHNSWFHKLLIISLMMMIGQILLGTQVRQFVDEQVKLFGFEHKEFRLLNPSVKFYVHRSFTILVVIVNALLFLLNQKYRLGYRAINWVTMLLCLEAFTGILMFYVNFPFGTQAIHLMSGAILFGILLQMLFISHRTKSLRN